MTYPLTQSATIDLPVTNFTMLLNRYQTPFYVYDLQALRSQCEAFRAAFPFPWFSLYFATMANDRPAVLEHLARLGVGACVNSLSHLDLALESGFPPQKVQLSSTGVTRMDMKRLLSLGVHLNADSVRQVEQWSALGGRVVGLRINAASLSSDRPEDRIGMSLEDIDHARSFARENGLKVSALHVYIGTNLQSHERLLPTVANLFNYAEQFDELEYLNIGGGVGVNYQHEGAEFDLNAYGAEISAYHRKLTQALDGSVDVIVEPGRKLTASCGKMLSRVTDVKDLHGRRYVIVDASIALFPRPFHHPDSPHRIRYISEENNHPNFPYSEAFVVGRTTFSRDILGKSMLPTNIAIDDVLVFDDAGSYCQSMETRFLGQRPPEIVVLNGPID